MVPPIFLHARAAAPGLGGTMHPKVANPAIVPPGEGHGGGLDTPLYVCIMYIRGGWCHPRGVWAFVTKGFVGVAPSKRHGATGGGWCHLGAGGPAPCSARWPVGPVAGRARGRQKKPPRHGGGWPQCVGGMSGGSCGSVFGVVSDSLAGIHAEDGEVGTPVAESFLVVALRREFDLSLALLDAVERVADVHWAPPALAMASMPRMLAAVSMRTVFLIRAESFCANS